MTKIDPGKVPQRKLFTGALMPAVGMGTFGSDHVSAQEVSQAVAGAVEAGYRSFDCAACYGNEAQIGQVFADAFARETVKREELFIASKMWNDMHGDGDVLIACARTLKDLKLDYLDMYYVHWPFPNYHAPGCDVDSRNPDARPFSVEEFMKTWRQMERLVDMGLPSRWSCIPASSSPNCSPTARSRALSRWASVPSDPPPVRSGIRPRRTLRTLNCPRSGPSPRPTASIRR